MITEKEEEEARDLFMLPGWRSLMEQIEDQMDLCNLDACNTLEDLHFNKGRLAVLRMFHNYEDYVTRVVQDEEYELQ
jgi:hypothetical protein